MHWLNEPSNWSEDESGLLVNVEPNTDFWRVTGYGFVRDNGHVYGETQTGDFTLTTRVQAGYEAQYDQAGATVRVDEGHWIKTGIEQFNGKLRFSTVVTSVHSNWMMADLPANFDYLNLKLERIDDSVQISCSTDDHQLELASIVYLEVGAPALVGVMCASPDGEGFSARFRDFVISRN